MAALIRSCAATLRYGSGSINAAQTPRHITQNVGMCGSMTHSVHKGSSTALGAQSHMCVCLCVCLCVCACRSIAVCKASRVELKYKQGGAWAGAGGWNLSHFDLVILEIFPVFFSNSNQPYRCFSQ